MKADTLTLVELPQWMADDAADTIARHALNAADLMLLMDVVHPAPFDCDPATAPRSGARPRYGI